VRLDHLLSKEQLAPGAVSFESVSVAQWPRHRRTSGGGCSRVEHRLSDIDAGRHTQVQASLLRGWAVERGGGRGGCP
jgi:hypothetical protein